MMIPFRRNEVDGDRRKALFNGKLSQVRTMFTEVQFGRTKNEWRILQGLRSNLEILQQTIIACFVLRKFAFQHSKDIAEEIHSSDEVMKIVMLMMMMTMMMIGMTVRK